MRLLITFAALSVVAWGADNSLGTWKRMLGIKRASRWSGRYLATSSGHWKYQLRCDLRRANRCEHLHCKSEKEGWKVSIHWTMGSLRGRQDIHLKPQWNECEGSAFYANDSLTKSGSAQELVGGSVFAELRLNSEFANGQGVHEDSGLARVSGLQA
jgi:hypothetical protein